jgi:hypothetical protein
MEDFDLFSVGFPSLFLDRGKERPIFGHISKSLYVPEIQFFVSVTGCRFFHNEVKFPFPVPFEGGFL